jgi:hypothetical protein
MPYSLILLVVVLAISGRFVLASDASTQAKSMVALVCAASIALPHALPQWQLFSLLVQVFLVIALLLHAKIGA